MPQHDPYISGVDPNMSKDGPRVMHILIVYKSIFGPSNFSKLIFILAGESIVQVSLICSSSSTNIVSSNNFCSGFTESLTLSKQPGSIKLKTNTATNSSRIIERVRGGSSSICIFDFVEIGEGGRPIHVRIADDVHNGKA